MVIAVSEPNVGQREYKNLAHCIDSGWVSAKGSFVTEFEKRVAESMGSTAAGFATCSGTTALHLSLHCVGVKSGDLVICPGFSFIATANAIAHAGATPWFFDIDSSNWCLDVEKLEAALEQELVKDTSGVWVRKDCGRPVSAIMPVYTLGNTPDLQKILNLARKYDLKIVADAACAVGSTHLGEKLARYADLSCLSFNGNKLVTTGCGGMIVGGRSDNEEKQPIELARHVGETARVLPGYDHDRVGYNYRMSNIEAAVGCAQLDRLDEFLERKQQIRDFYKKVLEDLDGMNPFPDINENDSCNWLSGVVIENSSEMEIEDIKSLFRGASVQLMPFWKPLHLQPPFVEAPCQDLSVTEQLWTQIFALPCSTGITDEQLKIVADLLRSFSGTRSK
jgi:perosamine synthetase